MTSEAQIPSQNSENQYRVLRHAGFWLAYYVIFSLIWASPPERGYFASFYLEFVLMPLRILASYCMMYLLIPSFLSNRKLVSFLSSYMALICVAGGIQMVIGHFFYDPFMDGRGEKFSLSAASWVRNMVLINSTVILLGAAKVLQLHFQLVDSLASDGARHSQQANRGNGSYVEVKSNRQTHRLRIDDIEYIEGMGNYICYMDQAGGRTVVYSSLKAAQEKLPDCFVRIHRSYLVNRNHIKAYDNDAVTVGSKQIPRARDIDDDMLHA